MLQAAGVRECTQPCRCLEELAITPKRSDKRPPPLRQPSQRSTEIVIGYVKITRNSARLFVTSIKKRAILGRT